MLENSYKNYFNSLWGPSIRRPIFCGIIIKVGIAPKENIPGTWNLSIG